ncbi:hypothetical protein LXL04_026593 [Taraxacum kok-saghyz]
MELLVAIENYNYTISLENSILSDRRRLGLSETKKWSLDRRALASIVCLSIPRKDVVILVISRPSLSILSRLSISRIHEERISKLSFNYSDSLNLGHGLPRLSIAQNCYDFCKFTLHLPPTKGITLQVHLHLNYLQFCNFTYRLLNYFQFCNTASLSVVFRLANDHLPLRPNPPSALPFLVEQWRHLHQIQTILITTQQLLLPILGKHNQSNCTKKKLLIESIKSCLCT